MSQQQSKQREQSRSGTPRGGAVWALVITSVAGFMAALDNLVVTTALPSIRKDLGGALDDLEWTVSAYTLTFAVLLMFGAALGDRFGRRRLFLVGLTVFTGASAAAAMAPGIDSLIAARAVQGVGAAIMMPLTLTLLTAAVPAAKRGMAFGIWGAVNGLAVASGPAHRRQPHRAHLLALDLLAERPARPGRCSRSPGCASPSSHGTGARARRPRHRAGQRRPLRHRLRPGRAAPADGWTSSHVLAGLIAARVAARRLRRPRHPRQATRCCPCGSSAPAPSPGSTRPAC